MGEKKVVLFFAGIFLLTQILGLYIGNEYIQLIKAGEAEPFFENPESVENSVILLIYMLLMTALVLLIIKYRIALIRALEAVAIFVASAWTFDFLFPVVIYFIPVSLILASALTAWKILRPSVLNQNLALIFSIAGVGAILGASLGVFPVLVFIACIAIYDFISVFLTKHMVYIAKEITKTPTAFTVAFPYKFEKPKKVILKEKKMKKKIHVFQLGGGDIALPLIFSVSVLKSFGLIQAIFSVFGALLFLSILVYYVTKRPGTALPGIPWISCGMLTFFIISLAF
ncbi:MAG: presenilin family intramembrane aspartyl protease [Candidatus Aenigmatarchaeota archaeon]